MGDTDIVKLLNYCVSKVGAAIRAKDVQFAALNLMSDNPVLDADAGW